MDKKVGTGKPDYVILGGREQLLEIGPLHLTGSRAELLEKKTAYLESTNVKLKYLELSPNLETLAKRIMSEMVILFDPKGERGISIILLMHENDMYEPLIRIGPEIDLTELEAYGGDSIIRSAAEVEALNRGILYFPDTTKQSYFLATKHQTYNRQMRGIEARQHQLYMGELPTGIRNRIDPSSLRVAPALVACPILKFNYQPAFGAFLLAGPKNFLDPEVDLIPLRILADQAALPMQTAPAE